MFSGGKSTLLENFGIYYYVFDLSNILIFLIFYFFKVCWDDPGEKVQLENRSVMSTKSLKN